MKSNNLSLFSTALLSLLLLSSCAETSYDGRTRANPLINKMEQPPAPITAAPRQQPTEPQAAVSNYPVLSFVETEVDMDGELVARLEVQLSQASASPVTAIVTLENATAIHYRDFAGFKIPGKIKYSRNEAETRQTIVIPPGTTRMALPDIGGITTRFCDAYFNAKLNKNNVQNAQIVEDTARVNVPCVNAYPSEPAQPVIVEPPPVSRIQEPVPCPPQAAVEARFKSDLVKTFEHARRAEIKVVLDQASSLPVVIDVETQDGTAYAGIDYKPVKMQVVIPAGKKSVEFEVDLIRAHRCAPPGSREHDERFEFSVVATQIANANMQRPEIKVSVKKDVDDDRGCLQP